MRFDRTAQLVEAAPDTRQQFCTLLCERHGARVTPEQWYADVRLERLDLRADGGRRHAELLRCGRKAEVGGDGLEDPQGVQRDAVGRGCHAGPCVKGYLTIRMEVLAGKASS
jgi:hypothetical protein